MTPAVATPPAGHRLWGGRFADRSAPALDALNRSIGVDFRLWPHDIRLSKAWAVALWGAGVLTLDESKAIEKGLDAVASRFLEFFPHADVHRLQDAGHWVVEEAHERIVPLVEWFARGHA